MITSNEPIEAPAALSNPAQCLSYVYGALWLGTLLLFHVALVSQVNLRFDKITPWLPVLS